METKYAINTVEEYLASNHPGDKIDFVLRYKDYPSVFYSNILACVIKAERHRNDNLIQRLSDALSDVSGDVLPSDAKYHKTLIEEARKVLNDN